METSEGFQQSRSEGKMSPYKPYDPTDSIIRAIGIGLLIAFIFPVVVYVKGGFKYTIPNIEYFFSVLMGVEEMSPLGVIHSLYPLFAGIVLLSGVKWKRGVIKAMTLLVMGLFPFLSIVFNREFQRGFAESTRELPSLIFWGVAATLLVAAIVAILAGAHTVRVNPDKKSGAYAASVGAVIYCFSLLIPINGQFQLFLPFKSMFAKDTSGTGLPFIFGLVTFLAILVMIIITILCFLLPDEKRVKSRAGIGKTIITLWVLQLFIIGTFIIYFWIIGMQSQGVSFKNFFPMLITIMIKVVPWILGLFLLIPLGTAELLLLGPAPRPLHEKAYIKTPPPSPPSPPRKRIDFMALFKKASSKIFKKIALLSPRVRVIILIFILVVIVGVYLYYNLRPNPEATADLMAATKKGDLKKVRVSILEKADVNTRDKNGSTPLINAVIRRDLELVRMLVDQGADVNAVNRHGYTPLLWATQSRNTEIVRLLLHHGADVNARDKRSNTPLINASQLGNEEIARLLIDKGADVNVKNEWGTPLHYAINKKSLTALLLIEKGASVSAVNSKGESPLHLAVRANQLEIVKKLVSKGANINSKRGRVSTPLYMAVSKGHIEIVRFLLDKRANINEPGAKGDAPLHASVKKVNVEITRLLLEKGANVNIRDKQERTPLHFAVQFHEKIRKRENNLELVQTLLDFGADVNAIDRTYGNTPLHEAVYRAFLEVVKILVENGADFNIKNKNGQTALEISKSRSFRNYYQDREIKEIAAYLESKSTN